MPSKYTDFAQDNSMNICAAKQDERQRKIDGLNLELGSSNTRDAEILSIPASSLHEKYLNSELTARRVWEAYTKKSIECHAKTNCLTELIDWETNYYASNLIDGKNADSANFSQHYPALSLSTDSTLQSSDLATSDSRDAKHHPEELNEKCSIKAPIDYSKGPLAGVPVSIKDNFGIAGYDASMGFPSKCHKPIVEDNPLIRLLKDAGAILYTKTNIPTGMLSIMSSNAIWGTTSNPRDASRGPGGSSSGEGALIGGGGSRIGVGTDIGGSVRIPAHLCGIYSLRMSQNRFPRFWLQDASTPGFEGIPDVSSPLAKSIADLRFFIEGVMAMNPSRYSYQLLPIPWNSRSTRPRKVGVLNTDNFLTLTPPVKRALDLAADALRKDGVEVVEFELPESGEIYDQAYASLILADGLETAAKPLAKGEKSDPVIDGVRAFARLPQWLKSLVVWLLRKVIGQTTVAAELKAIGPFSVTKYYENVKWREELRNQFWLAWQRSEVDILLAPVLPTPALPLDAIVPDSVCNYCAIFNLLDYPAGVIPVTTVDREKDQPDPNLEVEYLNWQSQSYLRHYDPEQMHGLSVGIQLVGMRLQDEQVLDAMEYLDSLLN